MVTYQYRCPSCGEVDVRRPMGEAPAELNCPGCGTDAHRVFTAPRTRQITPGLAAALDTAGRSAESPDVVTAPPAGRAPRARTTHPLHARLPRP